MSALTEAIEHLESTYFGHSDDGALVAAAARRVAEAPEVWWCEEHGSKGSERRCEWSMRYHYAKRYCRMVRKLLVDSAEET